MLQDIEILIWTQLPQHGLMQEKKKKKTDSTRE